jgi:hypothetical protein
MTRLRYEGGKFGIYEGSDNLPLGAPRSYLSRVKVHSDLAYVALDPTPLTATFQVAATDNARKRILTVGAHGKGFVPFVQGFVDYGGFAVPLVGSVPVYVNTVTGSLVLWTLAVNATSVIIHEQRSYPSLGTGLSYAVTVYVSNLALA